jgi:hypothetical protein
VDQELLEWQTVTFAGSEVAFSYPAVTPQGQTVERVVEQARDHRGDIERMHLSSPDKHELYVEVIRFRDLSAQEEYERHRSHLEQRLGEGSVTPLNETTFGERPAWTYGFRWDDGERSVLSLEVDGDTYRILWNPRSELNSKVVATMVVRSESE